MSAPFWSKRKIYFIVTLRPIAIVGIIMIIDLDMLATAVDWGGGGEECGVGGLMHFFTVFM